MSEWQPIETAPKGGERFIALTKEGLAFTAYNQAYYSKFPHEDGGPEYRWEWTIIGRDSLTPCSDLTHWKPLDEPPW